MSCINRLFVCLIVCGLTCGCEADPEADSYLSETVDAVAVEASSEADETVEDPDTTENNELATEVASESNDETASDEPEVGADAQVARRGVGTKGKGYGGGIVSEPVRVYFGTRERIVFQIQVPNALKTFKAMDSRGKGPKTHDEFMSKVIQENSIALPELPDDKEYIYDPKTEKLMVQSKS